VTVDALIVGAGPAGCAAAARLARDGAAVVLVHRTSGNPRRSESLPGAAARVLSAAGLGTVDALTEGRCGGTLSAWGTDRLAAWDTFASPDGTGWFIDRAIFDAALRRRCAEMAVAVRTDHAQVLRRVGRRWCARFAEGPDVVAQWVIDATGRTSAVARRMGAIRRTSAPLVAVHAARPLEEHEVAPTRVFLESEPDGWWYVGASSRHDISAVAVVRPVDARSRHVRGPIGRPATPSALGRRPARVVDAVGVAGGRIVARPDVRRGLDRLRRRRGGVRSVVVAGAAGCTGRRCGCGSSDLRRRHRHRPCGHRRTTPRDPRHLRGASVYGVRP
jgi:2-polyprenyl-6-methoxyphenol hydroxylase-like FAD-dependent oxidoreductase